MSFTVTRDFSAPPEVVFGTATDLNRWGRWLPAGVRIERAGPGEVRVIWRGGTDSVRWHVTPEELRVTARPVGQEWWASLTVAEGSAGGCTAWLEIGGPGGPPRATAERALAHLGEEVSDNLSAG